MPTQVVDQEEQAKGQRRQRPSGQLAFQAGQAQRPRGGSPPTDHQAGPVEGNVGGNAVQRYAVVLLEVLRKVVCRSHFNAHVEENGNHAHPHLRVGKCALAALFRRRFRGAFCVGPAQVHVPKNQGKQNKQSAQRQIRDLNGRDVQRRSGAGGRVAKNGVAHQQRPHGGAHVVHAAGQTQAHGAGFRRAQGNRQRVGHGLLQTKAQTHHNQAAEQQGKGGRFRGWNEEQGAQGTDDEAVRKGARVAPSANEVRSGQFGKAQIPQRSDGVCHVKGEGNHLALPLFQVQFGLEDRDQNAVAGRHKAPEEEDGDQGGQRGCCFVHGMKCTFFGQTFSASVG